MSEYTHTNPDLVLIENVPDVILVTKGQGNIYIKMVGMCHSTDQTVTQNSKFMAEKVDLTL